MMNMVLTVRGSQGKSKYQGAKVNKDAENFFKIFAHCSHIAYIFTFKFVPLPLFLL